MQGFRGAELITAARDPERPRRILILGDSFTYGVGSAYEDTFVALLDAGLPRTQLINTGVGGYCQRNQLAVLDQLGRDSYPISSCCFSSGMTSRRTSKHARRPGKDPAMACPSART